VLEKARMKREEWTSVSEYGTTLRSRAICRMPLCLPSLAPSSPCSSGSAPSRTSDALHRAPTPGDSSCASPCRHETEAPGSP